MPATCMATAMHRSAIPAKLEKKGPRKSFAHQRKQGDKNNRHHADDAGRKLRLSGLDAKRARELELTFDGLRAASSTRSMLPPV